MPHPPPNAARSTRVCLALAALAAALAPSAARAQEGHGHAEHALGRVVFPASCSAPARAELERGVALLHHMTYPRARESFERAASLDPRCALAHWGVAMTLFQPLWPTRPSLEERRRGWAEVEKARAIAPQTERERLLVDAAAAFFERPESADYWPRVRRWEQAMRKAHDAAPGDHETAVFFALAHLAVAPSDTISLEHAERAARLLLGVYEANPEHPGAMHYLVHANDVPGREREWLQIVRKYETAAPRNPHALHMPTHIYTRVGDWDAVIRGNHLAAEAALEHPAGEGGSFVWDEFPHAVEYLVYAQLQQGADDSAAAQVRRLHGTANLQPSFKTAFHLASTSARLALERKAWREAMALRPREPASLDWDHFPWAESVTFFARGLGAAHEGALSDARASAVRLDTLEASAARSGETLFARSIRVLGLGVRAWIAQADGDAPRAVALMREAAELEVATPKHAVTPGPTIPSHELLGDLLMEQKRPAEALAAYERSLALYPRRFNSLLGAARAARAAGDEARARGHLAELRKVAAGSRRAIE